MSVLSNTLPNGVDSGLVILREVVAYGGMSSMQEDLSSRREQTGKEKGAILRVVSMDSDELIKY